MGIVKGILFLALLIVLASFLAMNSAETVDIHLYGRDFLDIQLIWVLLVAFLLGAFVSFVVGVVRELRFHAQVRALRRVIQTREKEIVELRTLPLQDFKPEPAPEGHDG